MIATTIHRPELLAATDQYLAKALESADPMVLRAILYQLTGDTEMVDIEVTAAGNGIFERMAVARPEDAAMIRRKALDFLVAYRDAGADEMPIGPTDRLSTSVKLAVGLDLDEDATALGIEELAFDPWVRSVDLRDVAPAGKLADFSVTVIGAGMAGLNTAVQLKYAGLPFRLIEKNDGVGGAWHENHYPGARVDTSSRSYTHIIGADYPYTHAFGPRSENKEYFDWIADFYDVRDSIVFNTEVISLTWHDDRGMWEIITEGAGGREQSWSNVVVTAVGFLNRPKIPAFPGIDDFQGMSWHTSRWPDGTDLTTKRLAVIGTGATGYQLTPVLAEMVEHLTVFQRTPAWLLPVPSYLSKLPDDVFWLDRNLPYHMHFTRLRATRSTWMMAALSEIDPDFDDPEACNAGNKKTREGCIAFLEEKLQDPELVARLTPPFPVLCSRPIAVDPTNSFLDAIQRDKVELVSGGLERINATGILDDAGVQHDVDAIVYATGFHATEYLFPMEITGRDGVTIEQEWADGGARAYRSVMIPGFPNLFTVYGPNTNAGLPPAGIGELSTLFLLKCIERLLVEDKHAVEVKREAYDDWTAMIDRRNLQKVWSDPRAHSYYWTEYGRSATMNPLTPTEVWNSLREPEFSDLEIS